MNLHQMLLLLVRTKYVQSKKQLSDMKIMSVLKPLDKLFTKADRKDTKLVLSSPECRMFRSFQGLQHSFVLICKYVWACVKH